MIMSSENKKHVLKYALSFLLGMINTAIIISIIYIGINSIIIPIYAASVTGISVIHTMCLYSVTLAFIGCLPHMRIEIYEHMKELYGEKFEYLQYQSVIFFVYIFVFVFIYFMTAFV